MSILVMDYIGKFQKSINLILKKMSVWYDAILNNFPNYLLAILILIVTIFIARYVDKLIIRLLAKSRMQLSAKKVIGHLSAVFVFSIGVFLILNILKLEGIVTTVLGAAGVAGLAIGLALQGTLSNTFSGILLSFIQTVKLGDWIETNNFSGEIVDINLRATTLKQADNNLVSIPNKMVVESSIKNHSLTKETQIILTCGVAYNSDLEFVKDLVEKAINKELADYIATTRVTFFYTEFADSSINFQIRFYVKSTKDLDAAIVKGRAIMLIKKKFDENGITIPFPMRTLQLDGPLQITKESK